MGNEIKRLLPRHFNILELCLAGYGNHQIAEQLGLTPQGVGLIVNSPIFQNELARRRASVEKENDQAHANGVTKAKEILEENAARAAQTHVDLLDNEDPKVQQASANAILDRVYSKQNQGQGSVMVLDKGAIQVLQVALSESEDGRQETEVEASGAVSDVEELPAEQSAEDAA